PCRCSRDCCDGCSVRAGSRDTKYKNQSRGGDEAAGKYKHREWTTRVEQQDPHCRTSRSFNAALDWRGPRPADSYQFAYGSYRVQARKLTLCQRGFRRASSDTSRGASESIRKHAWSNLCVAFTLAAVYECRKRYWRLCAKVSRSRSDAAVHRLRSHRSTIL